MTFLYSTLPEELCSEFFVAAQLWRCLEVSLMNDTKSRLYNLTNHQISTLKATPNYSNIFNLVYLIHLLSDGTTQQTVTSVKEKAMIATIIFHFECGFRHSKPEDCRMLRTALQEMRHRAEEQKKQNAPRVLNLSLRKTSPHPKTTKLNATFPAATPFSGL